MNTDEYGRLADAVREQLALDGFVANSCILAARLTGLALRELGVHAVEAMACEVKVVSPAYVAMGVQSARLGRMLTEEETDVFIAAGAWAVEMRFGEPLPGQPDRRGRGYYAHVVTLVDRRWLIDPTLPVVNRPEKELIVDPPFAWEIDYEEARTASVRRSANGTVDMRRLLPGRKDFTKAGDWWRPKPTDKIVDRILERVDARVA